MWGAAPATLFRSSLHRPILRPNGPGAHKGPAFFAYSDNYLIDVKFGRVVGVEASRSIRQAEVGAARIMMSDAATYCSKSTEKKTFSLLDEFNEVAIRITHEESFRAERQRIVGCRHNVLIHPYVHLERQFPG